jgi:hypothetical protein
MSQERPKRETRKARSKQGLPNTLNSGVALVAGGMGEDKEWKTQEVMAEKAKRRKGSEFVVPWAIVEKD